MTPAASSTASRTSVIPNQARRRARGTSVDPAGCAGGGGAKDASRPVGNDFSTMLVLSSPRTSGTFAQGVTTADFGQHRPDSVVTGAQSEPSALFDQPSFGRLRGSRVDLHSGGHSGR